MQYYEKVIAYADHVQVYMGDDIQLIRKLDDKINSLEVGSNRHKYWVEVRGRIFRNSHYSESFLVTNLEDRFAGNPNESQDVASILNSPVLLKWISHLGLFEEAIDDTLCYHIDNEVYERPTPEDVKQQSLNSLRFYNNVLKQGKTVMELFPYLPLLKWSVEGLIANRRLSEQFHTFLIKSVVPIARAQRQLILIFLELMEDEDDYIAQGLSPDTIMIQIDEAKEENDKAIQKELDSSYEKDELRGDQVKEVTLSRLFTRKYTPPETISVSVPPEPTNGDDPYKCNFCRLVDEVIENDERVMRTNIKNIGKAWSRHPFSYIHRIYMAKQRLNISDGYTIPISSILLIETHKIIQAHIKTYSQDRLLRNLRNMMEVVLYEARGADHAKMYFLAATYNIERDKYFALLDEMQQKGLATPMRVQMEKEWLERAGSDAGFYHA